MLVVLVVLALIVAGWIRYQRWEREKVAEAYEGMKLPAAFSLTDRRWVAGLDALRLQTGWTYTYDHEGDGVEAAAELTRRRLRHTEPFQGTDPV